MKTLCHSTLVRGLAAATAVSPGSSHETHYLRPMRPTALESGMIFPGDSCLYASMGSAAAAASLQSSPTLCDPIDHRRQPTRLPRPWDSPGKNTGVGCHFLLQCMKVKSESEVAQSCPTLSDAMDCSPPGSSIHGIFQARVLEWGAIVFSVRSAGRRIFEAGKLEGMRDLPDGASDKEPACQCRRPKRLRFNPCVGPLQYSCLENPTDRGACRATVHRVSKSRTRLKRLSTHQNR